MQIPDGEYLNILRSSIRVTLQCTDITIPTYCQAAKTHLPGTTYAFFPNGQHRLYHIRMYLYGSSKKTYWSLNTHMPLPENFLYILAYIGPLGLHNFKSILVSMGNIQDIFTEKV